MPEGREIPRLIGTSLIALGFLTSCGVSLEAASTALQKTIDASSYQPSLEATKTPIQESGLATATAETNDTFSGLIARAFEVSEQQLEVFENYGALLLDKEGNPLVYIKNKQAFDGARSISGLLPPVESDDSVMVGTRAEISGWVSSHNFDNDPEMMKLSGSSEGSGNDKIVRIKVSGDLFDQEATFIRIYPADTSQNSDWMVEMPDGGRVLATEIINLMNGDPQKDGDEMTFTQAVNEYQIAPQANN